LAEQFAELEELRTKYSSPLNTVSVAKFFADGVIEGVTGFLLEPYEEAAENGPDYYGEFLWDMEKTKGSLCPSPPEGIPDPRPLHRGRLYPQRS
jgi:predicted amidohydrolase YtcJ